MSKILFGITNKVNGDFFFSFKFPLLVNFAASAITFAD